MANILQQQQDAMNALMVKQQQESNAKIEALQQQITTPRSSAQTNNPNDTIALTPDEQAKKKWDGWSPKDKAYHFMENARKIKVQYDVHPYGTHK